ncbi:MAG: tyrosine--tRNA ligase [Thermoanaerobaculales bacterium]|jgi:tyrosyl-tRNA synthetase|nr:tyrosine--tRNA ligase [Thermoanaerobaculales bacterium]
MQPTTSSLDEQLAYLTKGCVDVVPTDELRAKLERFATTGRQLVVKVGFDPSAPDLHLGHTVVIRKMRHFQQLGHRVVFLIGDFTGLIGDPTGKKSTRPQLTEDEIEANAATYRRQIERLLDPDTTVVDFNSRWLGALSSADWIRLAAKVTVAQMLEREDFRKRYEAQQPISLHEFLYPLAQAYDSVALEADVELGGTDQLFNLLVGRHLMREHGLEPQVVMTLPLLEGLDGIEKMSKSLGNYIAVEDPPTEMFGKLMSISDELMWKYWLLLSDLTAAEIDDRRARVGSGELHPMEVKKELARTVVADFHSAGQATAAQEEFERVFSARQLPEDIAEIALAVDADEVLLAKILAQAGLAPSNSEARRLLAQGGVRVDGEVVRDVNASLAAGRPGSTLIQVGKRRIARLSLRRS